MPGEWETSQITFFLNLDEILTLPVARSRQPEMITFEPRSVQGPRAVPEFLTTPKVAASAIECQSVPLVRTLTR